MIQNLDAHLNKLQAQCDYLRHKLSTFPEGELSIQKNGSYHRWVIKNKEQSVYCSKSNRSLAEVMALKKYYSLLLFEAEEELSLLNFYIKSHEKKNSAANRSKPLTCWQSLLLITHYCKAILQRTSFRCLHRNGARRAMKPILLIRKI